MRPPVVAGKAVRSQCSHTIPQEAAFVNIDTGLPARAALFAFGLKTFDANLASFFLQSVIRFTDILSCTSYTCCMLRSFVAGIDLLSPGVFILFVCQPCRCGGVI